MARCVKNMLALIAVCCVSLVYARMAYQLPNGSEALIATIKTTFSCEDRRYGYYADTDNDCKLFHVCQPILDSDGNLLETAQFTFLCGNQTIFNQESLTCNFPEESLACEDAASLYEASNFNFGVVQP